MTKGETGQARMKKRHEVPHSEYVLLMLLREVRDVIRADGYYSDLEAIESWLEPWDTDGNG